MFLDLIFHYFTRSKVEKHTHLLTITAPQMLKKDDQEIVFYKSNRSERWWMEVPNPNNKVRYQKHHLVPCSYKDYETALREEMPERWWQAFQKIS